MKINTGHRGSAINEHGIAVWHAIWISLAFFLGLASAWCLFNFSYRHYPTDDGFVLALAWRILHGQIPYVDFIYIRPPLTPLLAAGYLSFLPEQYHFLAGRPWFYLEMAIAGFVPTLFFLKTRLSAPSPMELCLMLLLAGITWTWSLHNFPPMPWSTVDGVVFSSIAVTSLCFCWLRRPPEKSRTGCAALASCTAILAALAKQNFALIPAFVGIGLVLLAALRRDLRLFLWSAAGFLAPLLAVGGYLGMQGIREGMRQIQSASRTGALLEIARGYGLTPRIAPSLLLTSVLVGCLGAVHACRSVGGRGSLWSTTRSTALSLLPPVLMSVICYLYREEYKEPCFYLFWFFVAWFITDCACSLIRRDLDWPFVLFGIGTFLVALCASVSWGWRYPLLGFAPFGLLMVRLIQQIVAQRPWQKCVVIGAYVLCFLFTTFQFGSIHWRAPYRDASRPEQTANLADVLPRFGRVFTRVETAERYRNLLDLFRRNHGFDANRNRVVVLPEFPLWYFLTDTLNPTSIDWWLFVEYPRQGERLKQDLQTRTKLAILEMRGDENGVIDFRHPLTDDPMSEWIIQNWKPIDRQGSFCVFENPAM